MRKELFLAVATALKKLLNDNGSRLIAYIDLWNQNVDFAESYPFDTPAVFIELGEITYDKLKGPASAQLGQLSVTLHIVTSVRSLTCDSDADQDKALEFFDVIDKVHQVISSLEGEHFSRMMRTQSLTNADHAELREDIEIYTCKVMDNSAV